MSAFQTSRRLSKLCGLPALVPVLGWLLVAGAGAFAQDNVTGLRNVAGQADGAPRNLMGPSGRPFSAPVSEPPLSANPPSNSALRLSQPSSLPAPVSVGNLGTIEGPVVGTLNDANGGLGYDMWAGTDRSTVEMMLQRLPVAAPSPISRLLLRKVLLTEAALPIGDAERPFNALRIATLLEAGAIDDAGQLAGQVRSRDAETQRVQADALLYAGRDIDLCGAATSERLQSAEPFWIQLRAYCYLFDGNSAALDLTRAVMEAAGVSDPAYLQLLDSLAGNTPTIPDDIAAPTSLHIRMLVRLGMPIPLNAVSLLGLPVSVIAASSSATAPQIRRAAAERALHAGALSVATLTEILDSATFAPEARTVAATLARSEPLLDGLERLHAAFGVEQNGAGRAELVYAAFQIGHANGILPLVASLFSEEAVAIRPEQDWGNWSPLMARGLLLAGRPDVAARWLDIAALNLSQQPQTLHGLRIVMGLAAPTDQNLFAAQEPLASLAAESLLPDVTPATLVRATLGLGLYDTTGWEMPLEARSQVGGLVAIAFPGRRPAPLALQRIEQASLSGRRAELALGILDALGPIGPSEVAPDILVRCVRALLSAGMQESAEALRTEAILTRLEI